MQEAWRTIPNHSKYQVDENCNIRKVIHSSGEINYKQIKPQRTTEGYFTVRVMSDDGHARTLTIHKLGCLAFHGVPDSRIKNPTVDHIDGNILNNNINNLEWVSQSENVRRALARKTKQKYKVRCIETGELFNTISDLQKQFGFRYYTIYRKSITGGSIHGFHFERIYED